MLTLTYRLLFLETWARAACEEENIPGTKPKVLSCLKELPTSMRVDHFAGCENIDPRFQTPSIPHPALVSKSPRNYSTALALEFYYGFCYSEGLEIN